VHSKTRKTGNYVAWARDSDGYLKSCRDCGHTIYLKRDGDGIWRPYNSWIEGDATEGEWKAHRCRAANTEARALSNLSETELARLDAQIRGAVSVAVAEALKSKR
jgi:hypothetical protein